MDSKVKATYIMLLTLNNLGYGSVKDGVAESLRWHRYYNKYSLMHEMPDVHAFIYKHCVNENSLIHP